MDKKKQAVLFVVLGIFLMLIVYGTWIEPYQVDVRHLQIKDAAISNVLEKK